jgi:hypothetical protein
MRNEKLAGILLPHTTQVRTQTYDIRSTLTRSHTHFQSQLCPGQTRSAPHLGLELRHLVRNLHAKINLDSQVSQCSLLTICNKRVSLTGVPIQACFSVLRSSSGRHYAQADTCSGVHCNITLNGPELALIRPMLMYTTGLTGPVPGTTWPYLRRAACGVALALSRGGARELGRLRNKQPHSTQLARAAVCAKRAMHTRVAKRCAVMHALHSTMAGRLAPSEPD